MARSRPAHRSDHRDHSRWRRTEGADRSARGPAARDRLHWLLTDGAHSALFEWPGDSRPDRVVQVASVTRNVGLERLSARRNLNDPEQYRRVAQGRERRDCPRNAGGRLRHGRGRSRPIEPPPGPGKIHTRERVDPGIGQRSRHTATRRCACRRRRDRPRPRPAAQASSGDRCEVSRGAPGRGCRTPCPCPGGNRRHRRGSRAGLWDAWCGQRRRDDPGVRESRADAAAWIGAVVVLRARVAPHQARHRANAGCRAARSAAGGCRLARGRRRATDRQSCGRIETSRDITGLRLDGVACAVRRFRCW